MSDTPETDANILERRRMHKIDGSVQLLELVDADFCRKLERERDEFRAVLQQLINWNPELPFYMRDKDKDEFEYWMRKARELLGNEGTTDASDVAKDAEPQSYGEPQIIH